MRNKTFIVLANFFHSECRDRKSGVSTSQLREALEKENIETRPLWKPMHLQPIFDEYPYFGER